LVPVIGSVVQRPASGLSGAPVVDGLVSRLTYRDVTTNSGEVCGSITSSHGWFLKGYVGLGAISSGSLQDEDFPPAIVPYSSTTSQQHGGYLDYASIDVGYNLYRPVISMWARLSATTYSMKWWMPMAAHRQLGIRMFATRR
jgi:hypothetical protein